MAVTILLSVLSGLATPVGAVLVLKLKHLTNGILALILGLAAGIMLTVVVFDLIPGSLQTGGPKIVWVSCIVGWVLMYGLRKVAEARFSHHSGYLRMGWFMVIAIAMHDFPEGLAIGAGDAVNRSLGILIAVAIALHNIPEGMSIGAPLRMAGVSRRRILLLTLLVGLATPLGTGAALLLFQISKAFIGGSLGLAAGAMGFVVARDVWPEAFAAGRKPAFAGMLMGFLLMKLVSLAG